MPSGIGYTLTLFASPIWGDPTIRIAQCGWVGGAVEDNSEKTSDMLHQNDKTPLHDCFRPSEKSQLMVQ